SRRAVGKGQIRRSAEGPTKNDSAVNQDDHRVFPHEGVAVRAQVKVIEGKAILAVRREVVFELDAAPRAWRGWVFRILLVVSRPVFVDLVRRAGNARIGIAYGELSDVARRGNVLFEE